MADIRAVLITGAAGFIGSHLTERCLELGLRVVALDAFTEYYDESRKRRNIAAALGDPDCTLVEGDLLQLDLPEVLAGVNTVFHLAAQPGVRPSWDQFDLYVARNVNATQRLLDAATTAQVDRVVLASSSSVYGGAERLPTPEEVAPRPISPYGLTKVATEHLAQIYWRSFGLPTVCLRYFSVYGPRQRPDMAFSRLIESALTHKSFTVFGDGEQTRDFTFVDDAVQGTLAAAERGQPGSVYNVGGGSRRSVNDVFELLGALIGEGVQAIYKDSQRGDARDTAADITRAKRELGFEPTVSFEAGLQAQLQWQKALAASPEHDPPPNT